MDIIGDSSVITKITAILSLVPGAEVTVRGEEVTWHKPETPPVTEKQIQDELTRLLNQYELNEYQRLRAAEYPPVADFLDAIVKGDEAQKQAYIDACLAVKAKYPKPE